MRQEQDFETVKQNPKFQELNARLKELMDELKNSRGTERAAGREISRRIRDVVRSNVRGGECPEPSQLCMKYFMRHGGTPIASDPFGALEDMESTWQWDFERNLRSNPTRRRDTMDRRSRDREEQRYQDRLRRMQRDKELADMSRQSSPAGTLSRTRAGMNENKIKMTKSQLKQIIKEELEKT